MTYWLVRFLFPSAVRAIRGEGYDSAIKDILVFKDKIYTDTVILNGDYQTIANCTFLGNEYGLKIYPGTKTTL